MWCEQVLRNVNNAHGCEFPSRVIDFVDCAWNECSRVLRKSTRAGEPVRVLLGVGKQLRHGDVIFEDDHRIVVINVLSCEVLVAIPSNPRLFATLGLELGNLHWPAQVWDTEIVCLEDGQVLEVLQAHGIAWTRQLRRFEPDNLVSAPGVKKATDLRVIRGRSTSGNQSVDEAASRNSPSSA